MKPYARHPLLPSALGEAEDALAWRGMDVDVDDFIANSGLDAVFHGRLSVSEYLDAARQLKRTPPPK